MDWWTADPEVPRETTVDGHDVHAQRAETSVMLAISPHLVHLDEAATADDADRTEGLVFRYTVPALSTNGVTGRPSEATPELGSRLLEAVDAFREDPLVHEVFPAQMVSAYADMKQGEWDDYHRQVGALERTKYLLAF